GRGAALGARSPPPPAPPPRAGPRGGGGAPPPPLDPTPSDAATSARRCVSQPALGTPPRLVDSRSDRRTMNARRSHPMSIQSVNPTTGDVLETFTPTSSDALERMVTRAHAAFLE